MRFFGFTRSKRARERKRGREREPHKVKTKHSIGREARYYENYMDIHVQEREEESDSRISEKVRM